MSVCTCVYIYILPSVSYHFPRLGTRFCRSNAAYLEIVAEKSGARSNFNFATCGDIGINRADYIHSSDRGRLYVSSRSSNPHLSRAKPAPSYLRASHRGRWIVSSRISHQCSRRKFFLLFFVSCPRSIPSLLALFSHRASILESRGREASKIGGSLKKSFGKDQPRSERERER